LWNACRFRQMSGPIADNSTLDGIISRIDISTLDSNDHAILDRLLAIESEVASAFAVFEFSRAVQALYGFFWNDFCDWYVEVSKAKLQNETQRDTCLAIQDLVIRQSLLLLHPFTPFLTEELWHRLGYGGEGDFIQNVLPGCAASVKSRGISIDVTAVAETAQLKELVVAARALKAEYNLANKRDVVFFLVAPDEPWLLVKRSASQLVRLVGAASIERRDNVDGAPASLTPLGTLYLDLSASLDVGVERERLGRELEKLERAIASTNARLSNKAFTDKAPPAVVEGARQQLAETEARAVEIRRLLESLRG
jgi:valyl-tRNA synthetase